MDKPNKSYAKCQGWPSDNIFKEIFYQSPIGILFYDEEGRLTNANDSALKIARIPKLEDVLGINIFENPLIASKKEELHKKGLIKFQDSLNLTKIEELKIYNPIEQKIIDIDWTVSVTDSGYFIQIQEITKSKNAAETFNKSQKLLHDIINGFPSIIFVKDVDGRFLIINNKLEELLGLKSKELMGKTDYDLFSHEIAEYYRANDQKVLEDGKAIYFEEEADLIDGHHTFIANKFPIFDINGKPYGVGSISTDITERKHLEEQLKVAHENLEEKVEKRTEELLKSNMELKRSNDELKRFAYVSSHDLQEPLRMVTLYSQLLERRYKDKIDSDADDFIGYIVENAKRMKQLIDDLLDYSRVTGQAKEFENVEFESVLDVVLSNLSVSIAENNVKVTHDSLPTVFANKNQILQVFQNLITNSIKFRGEKSPKIDISAQKGEKEWTFELKDNGIGINTEHQEQIFEVFKRLHTREEYPGTGIGLSIVQKIIERHNGRIWVESEPEKGSTFYFTIPIKN